MSFDISRVSFNHKNDYQGVVMQQGRVQLDSDWNEWQAEFSRRLQAGTLDVFGRAAYPASTPSAFKIKISPSGDSLTIGAGRMYVDGLLAENHGILPPAFTVVAVDSLGNPGAYGVQLTPGTGAGTFNLSLFLTANGVRTPVGPTLDGPTHNGLTLATVQAAVSADSTLSGYIQIQNVAAVGLPQALAANTLYMLVPNGPDYAVTIPLAAAVSWDPALAELSEAPFLPGTPEFDIDYTQQPYLPGAQKPGIGHYVVYLVYLDVWQREITFLQHPELIEPAVGVDTTGRLQTVWQVKLLDVSNVVIPGGTITCSTPDADIPAWANLLLPPGGNLSTGVVQSAPEGPCSLTPNTSYTGMENQLYRVEIHQAGLPAGNVTPVSANPLSDGGAATFKWSRDNASVATAVSAITPTHNAAGNPVSKLTVQSLGRDQVLGFAAGNWIEITDDVLELNGLAGELHQIDSISVPDSTITLVDAIMVAANFPTTNLLTDPGRHTRILRWDQEGKVFESDGATLYCDLGAASSGGAIPVPPAGTTLVLENGVTVSFGLGASGQFRTGDYWNFAARAADGTVETLIQAPPLGIHHHYARLAVVDFASPPGNPADCRVAWPPANGCDCGCKVTVRPGDLTAQYTLQYILDQYAGVQSAVIISLMPGTYALPAPLRLGPGHSGITLEACQPGTAIFQAQQGQESQFVDGLIVLDGSSGITLSGLQFVMPIVPYTPLTFAGVPFATFTDTTTFNVSIGVRTISCTNLTIEDCQFQSPNLGIRSWRTALNAAIFAGGTNVGLQVLGNQFVGVGSGAAGFLLAPSVAFAPVPVSAGAAGNPLAAAGGTVLPSVLDDAVFSKNSFTGLHYAVFILAASRSVQIIGNEVTGDNGFCLLAPLSEDVAAEVAFCPFFALGFPLPKGSTATPSTVPPAPAAVRICTGLAYYHDKQQPSNLWTPDVQAPNLTISGTSALNSQGYQFQIFEADGKTPNPDATLYQSERYGASFVYTFSGLPSGFYQVTLKFAEIFNWASRWIDVALNGSKVLSAFNIVSEVGEPNRSDDKVFANVAVSASGQLTVAFTEVTTPPLPPVPPPPGTYSPQPQPAKISAVAIQPQWTLQSSLQALGVQGYAGIAMSPSQLRCANNDVRSAAGIGLQVSGDDTVVNGKESSLLVVGNCFESPQPYASGVIISAVTRCVVTGNMIVYDSPSGGSAFAQNSLRLDNGWLTPGQGNNGLTNSAGVAVSVTGNILQGTLSILPPPPSVVQGANVPAPMNQWAFFNTIIT